MKFTPEQDVFIASNRYRAIEANRELFPEMPTHDQYISRRLELQQLGLEPIRDPSTGRFARKSTVPRIEFPELFNETDGAELWQAVQAFQDTHRSKLTQHILTDVAIKIETDQPFGVAFLSDWHIGSLGTDHAAIMRDIELVNACPNLVAYVGGDPTDNFIPEKLAHAARDGQAASPDFQWRMYRHAIEKILPSLLAVGRGNHDAWTSRNAGIDGILQALRGVPVLHTGEDTYIDLTVGEETYVIYRKHRPIGSSRTNRTAGAKKSYDLGKRLFDVGVTEHHHEAAINSEARHGAYRWFITTGSYKVSDAHSREWGFMHGGIGTPVVVFYPFRRKMVGFMELEDAIDFLDR